MSGLVRAALAGTGAFVATSVLSLTAGGVFSGIGTAVALGLFAVGCAAFVGGYLTAVGRSRTHQVELASLFFLVGPVAPPPVKRALLGAYLVQIVTAVAVAAVGLSGTSDSGYNAQAFAILAPVFGQGMVALWAARHGTFPPRGAGASARAAADR